ncbi:MAG: hypothetical protein V2J24_20075 [Pseudomonadales bacterium]|jgi:hypothetical protein|nr:hypothetical protein [Pseudomonadales bacterium]
MAKYGFDGIGERKLERVAELLFVEMAIDRDLARLFGAASCEEAVEDLRALLRVLFADTPVGAAAEPNLCPALTGQPLDAACRLRVARLFVDCMVEAQLPPNPMLAALDRLYAVMHRDLRDAKATGGVPDWGRERVSAQ